MARCSGRLPHDSRAVVSRPSIFAQTDTSSKGENDVDDAGLKDVVKARYSEVAEGAACCGSLCGCSDNAEGLALAFGYSADELATLPEGANLGLSCGNPQALAALKPGEV